MQALPRARMTAVGGHEKPLGILLARPALDLRFVVVCCAGLRFFVLGGVVLRRSVARCVEAARRALTLIALVSTRCAVRPAVATSACVACGPVPPACATRASAVQPPHIATQAVTRRDRLRGIRRRYYKVRRRTRAKCGGLATCWFDRTLMLVISAGWRVRRDWCGDRAHGWRRHAFGHGDGNSSFVVWRKHQALWLPDDTCAVEHSGYFFT